MAYDRGDSFPFDFERHGTPFCSKSKGKLSLRSYPNQFKRKWNTNFLSVPVSGCYRQLHEKLHRVLRFQRVNSSVSYGFVHVVEKKTLPDFCFWRVGG